MLLALVRFERQPSPAEAAQGAAPVQSPISLVATYVALFRFSNLKFRYVLLKALAVAVAAAIGFGFNLPYPHWVPLYTLIIYVFTSTVVVLVLHDFSTPGSLADVRARLFNVLIGALISVMVVYLFMLPSQKKESSTSSVASR